MIKRDIPKRMNVFGNDMTTIPIALTREQIEKYNIPTDQITKEKDSTKEWYTGLTNTDKCWELDALSPEILQSILEERILEYLDISKFDDIKEKEQEDIREMNK